MQLKLDNVLRNETEQQGAGRLEIEFYKWDYEDKAGVCQYVFESVTTIPVKNKPPS